VDDDPAKNDGITLGRYRLMDQSVVVAAKNNDTKDSIFCPF